MSYFAKNAQVEDYIIKSQRLCIPFSIVANATPANKTYSSALPQAFVLSAQGLTSAAAAIDSGCNFSSPQDASSAVFGVLLYNLGTVQTVQRAAVDMPSAGSLTVALNGASSSGVTASGNIALSATWASNSLATTNLSATLSVDYIIAKS